MKWTLGCDEGETEVVVALVSILVMRVGGLCQMLGTDWTTLRLCTGCCPVSLGGNWEAGVTM